jgi:hypothetical protein
MKPSMPVRPPIPVLQQSRVPWRSGCRDPASVHRLSGSDNHELAAHDLPLISAAPTHVTKYFRETDRHQALERDIQPSIQGLYRAIRQGLRLPVALNPGGF